MNNFKWDNTFPKQKFDKCSKRRERDNALQDKKAEICRLREENARLLEALTQ